RTVLEVAVPYGEQALVEYLGRRPEQFCSADTSRLMARRAYERAGWLAPGQRVVGLGCTASLATDRPKRGDHRLYITTHSAEASAAYSLTLRKGARDRPGEEVVLDLVLLQALAAAFDVPARLQPGLHAEEVVHVERQPAADALE